MLNHSIDGVLDTGLLASTSALAQVNAALYIFRMPALAFLLGLFIPRSLAKRGTHRYLADRVGLVLYLYLLWFFIQGSAEILTSGVKNNPRDPASLLRVWDTFAHLWFLPFLAVRQCRWS